MAYVAPSGRIDTVAAKDKSDSGYRRFHLLRNCDAIQATSSMVTTGRPYGVQRCNRSARR
jgi:hypothetical protein